MLNFSLLPKQCRGLQSSLHACVSWGGGVGALFSVFDFWSCAFKLFLRVCVCGGGMRHSAGW